MRSIVATLKRSGLLVLGFAGSVLAQGSLPRPLPVYFLEVRTNIAGESATVAEDITTSMETAFSSRRQSFRLIEKRDLGEVERQILANLEVGKKPSPALIAKARSAYGFVRGELVRRDDGVELRVKMIAMDSEILWAQEKTLSLLKWKDGEARREVAAWLAADAEAQVFSVPVQPGPPARKPEDAEMGINAASKGDCAKARPFLENASAIDPNNAEVYFWLSRCQNLEGQSQAAGESATHGLLAKQRPDLFLERAVSLLARGQTSAAIQDIDRALKINPNDPAALELKGDALMRLGGYAEAISNYGAAYSMKAGKDNCRKLADAYRKNGTPGQGAAVDAECQSLR